jgi:uncharacterized protein YdbL (DUF1318 family)
MVWLRYLPTILAASAIGLTVWWVMALRLDNAALRAERADLERSVISLRQQAEQSRLAREVEIERAERWKARASDLSARIETILLGDFPDAALDPDLADLLNRLREGN